jgi:hypothetical protein
MMVHIMTTEQIDEAQVRLYNLPTSRKLLGGISHEGIYKRIRTGQLNPTKVGRRTMISSAELTRFIRERTDAWMDSLREPASGADPEAGQEVAHNDDNPDPTSDPRQLPVHPVADCFPMLDDQELQDLAADIAEHGLHQPVVVQDHVLIDGRNRLAACEIAGTPSTAEVRPADQAPMTTSTPTPPSQQFVPSSDMVFPLDGAVPSTPETGELVAGVAFSRFIDFPDCRSMAGYLDHAVRRWALAAVSLF